MILTAEEQAISFSELITSCPFDEYINTLSEGILSRTTVQTSLLAALIFKMICLNSQKLTAKDHDNDFDCLLSYSDRACKLCHLSISLTGQKGLRPTQPQLDELSRLPLYLIDFYREAKRIVDRYRNNKKFLQLVEASSEAAVDLWNKTVTVS